MPQLTQNIRERFLDRYSGKIDVIEVDARNLRATQNEISAEKVNKMVSDARSGGRNPCDVNIITAVGSDSAYRVVDGHHRAAACNVLDGRISVVHVNSPVDKVIRDANSFLDVNQMVGGDTDKAKKVKEIDSLALSLASTAQANHFQNQRLFSLLEGFSRDEQLKLMGYFRQTQNDTTTRASIMGAMSPFWITAKKSEVINYVLEQGVKFAKEQRKLNCQLPGNRLICKLEDAILNEGILPSTDSQSDSFCNSSSASQVFCEGNLGIDRAEMPQIPECDKETFLQRHSNKAEDKKISATDLRSTQFDLSARKIDGMVREARKGGRNPCNVSIITALGPNNTLRVVDGHHRAAACSLLGGQMTVSHIHSPVDEVVRDANSFIQINTIIDGDPSKARKIQEIEALGSSLVPNTMSMHYRYQRIATLLEGFSREEQQVIMRHYRQSQTDISSRASIMGAMVPLWSVKKAFDGLGYALNRGYHFLKKSRETVCSIPGNNLACKLDDLAYDATVTAAKSTYAVGKAVFDLEYQISPTLWLAGKAAQTGRDFFNFSGQTYSKLTEWSAEKLWVKYDITVGFTRDSFQGAKIGAELIALNYGLRWASSFGTSPFKSSNGPFTPRSILAPAEGQELQEALRLYEELINPRAIQQKFEHAYNTGRIEPSKELFNIFNARHKDATIKSAGKIEAEDFGFKGIEVAMGNKFFTSDTAVFLVDYIQTSQQTWISSLRRLQEVAREEGCKFVELMGEFVEPKLSRVLEEVVTKRYNGKVELSKAQYNGEGILERETKVFWFPAEKPSVGGSPISPPELIEPSRTTVDVTRSLKWEDIGMSKPADRFLYHLGGYPVLGGTISLEGKTVKVLVQNIRAEISSPSKAMNTLIKTAWEMGGDNLEILGSITNRKFYQILDKRYGVIKSDIGSTGPSHKIRIPLK